MDRKVRTHYVETVWMEAHTFHHSDRIVLDANSLAKGKHVREQKNI